MSVSGQVITINGFGFVKYDERTLGTDARGAVYGAPIPLSNGKRKLMGAPIWSSPLRDVAKAAVNPAVLQSLIDNYKFRDFAVAFGYNIAPDGEHEPPSVLRMWFNGNLIYDASDPAVQMIPGMTWTLYPGDFAQTFDSTIQADQGDLTPAYRPMIYIVFRDFSLPRSGYENATFDYKLPVVQVEFADGLVITNEDTDFAMLPGSSLTVENVQADWNNNLLYAISAPTTSAATLHTFDILGQAEISALPITGISYTNLEGFDAAVAIDERLGHIVLSGDGVQNSAPVFAIDVATGTLTGKFGSNSTGLHPQDADGNEAAVTGHPIVRVPWAEANDVCYIDGGAGPVAVAVVGGLFRDLTLIPLNSDGSFPASVPSTASTRFTGSGSILFIKRIRLLELQKTPGALQDGACIVGVDDSIYGVYFGLRSGQVKVLGVQLIHTFPGRKVIDAVIDPSSEGGLVCLHRADPAADYRATKFFCRNTLLASDTTSGVPGLGNNWNGLFPGINGPWVTSFLTLEPADTPIYDVSIADIITDTQFINSTKMAYPDGTIVYPSGTTMTLLKLANGSTQTFTKPSTFNDIVWDGRAHAVYRQNTTSHAMAVTLLSAAESSAKTIGENLRWLALRAGYADADIIVDPALTDPVLGIVLAKTYDASTLFTALGQVYDFYYFESGGKVHFSKVGRGADIPGLAFDLQVSDLAVLGENSLTPDDALVTTIQAPVQQTASLALSYIDIDRGYIASSQTFSTDKKTSDSTAATTVTVDAPVVMTAAEAYRRATKISLATVDNDVIQEFRLPQRYSRLEPTDLGAITQPPYRYIVRIDEATFNGDWSLSFSAKNFAFDDHITIPDESLLGLKDDGHGFGVSDSKPLALDIPVIERTLAPVDGIILLQTGVESYGQTSFTGASLISGPVGGPFAADYFAATDVKYGNVLGTLPDNTHPWCTDTVTELSIAMRSGDATLFASATYAEYVAGGNAVLIGKDDRWELVYFENVEVINAKVVKLTGLARGRRGTDVNIATHTTGETAILVRSLASTFIPVLVSEAFDAPARLGEVVRYSTAAPVTTKPPVNLDVTLIGNSAKPFTVAQVTMTDAGADDRLIAWMRRDRVGGEFVTIDQPLSEATESYDLEILSGSTVVRTVTALGSPSYTYTAANQTSDGFTTPLDTLKVRIFQNSAVVGRGFMKEETLDVS